MKAKGLNAIGSLALAMLFLGVAVCGADSFTCEKGVVSTGDSKAVVLDKCGPPFYKEGGKGKGKSVKAAVRRKYKTTGKAEIWTYKLEGCYRDFVFEGGKLSEIRHGTTY
ncbi:MAG: DUF2845 domain-containing protein [Smithellaceae bacterium]|nr:DUF2845 domain-containing protein [Smithellaceae bacterium]